MNTCTSSYDGLRVYYVLEEKLCFLKNLRPRAIALYRVICETSYCEITILAESA